MQRDDNAHGGGSVANIFGARAIPRDIITPNVAKPPTVAEPKTAQFKLRYSSDFDKAPAVRWQVEGILLLGGVTVLHGQPKSFKSYIAQSMGLSCASGIRWQGFAVRKCDV